MHSISYDTILEWIRTKEQPYRIPTLGRRSHILVSVIDGRLHVQGRTGAEMDFSRTYWDTICEIIDHINPEARRMITTEYVHAPVYRFAPSVPTICRQYCIEHEE